MYLNPAKPHVGRCNPLSRERIKQLHRRYLKDFAFMKENDKYYELRIGYPFKQFQGVKPEKQFEITSVLFDQINKCCSFAAVPELTGQNIIHYHFVLLIRNWVKWHKQVFPYLQRIDDKYHFKEVFCINCYLDYMDKKVEQNKQVFDYEYLPILNINYGFIDTVRKKEKRKQKKIVTMLDKMLVKL